MIDPTHATRLSYYRHQELLRQAKHARLVRLARSGRGGRPRQGLRFRLPAFVGRLFGARPAPTLAVESAPAQRGTPTVA